VDPNKDVRNPREKALDDRRAQVSSAQGSETEKDRAKAQEVAQRHKEFEAELQNQRREGIVKKLPPPIRAIIRIYAKGKANVGGMLARVEEVLHDSVKVMLPSGSVSVVPLQHIEFAKSGWEGPAEIVRVVKALHDRSHLHAEVITNKRGHKQTVWKRALDKEPGQKGRKQAAPKGEGPSHLHSTFDAIQHAQETIKTSDATTLDKARALSSLDRNTSEYVVSEVPHENAGPRVDVGPEDQKSTVDLHRDASTPTKVQSISLEDIAAEPEGQIRKTFDPDQIRELAESIASVGLMAPIVLRPDPKNEGKFKIVAGERRFRALSLLAQEGRIDAHADAIVRDLSDKEKDILQVIENHVRVNNTPLEVSEHYDKLIREHEMTPKQISEATGDSLQKVKDYLSLTRLAPELRTMLRKGDKTLNKTSAVILAMLPTHGEQIRAYSLMLRHNMTTGVLKEQVKQMLANRDVALFGDHEGKGAAQVRAEKELGDKNPDKLVGNLNKFLEDQKQRLYKFINSQGDLSAIGVIAAGQAQKSMEELDRIQGEIERIKGLIRKHHARLTEAESPALFKSFLVQVGRSLR
jgi:ParB family chromosome partitioning protein